MSTDPGTLAAALASPSQQVRTGVLLYPIESLPALANLAARLGCAFTDLAVEWLDRAEPGSRYLGIDEQALLHSLDAIASREHPAPVVLVANADLLFARLDDEGRAACWHGLRTSLKRRAAGLLIALPETSRALFPSSEIDRWSEGQRLARLFAGAPEGSHVTHRR